MATRRGKKTRKVVIQQLTQTVDSPGGVVETYSTYATRWMAIEPMSSRGSERFLSDQDFAVQWTKFAVDYDALLHESLFGPEMRLALSNLDSPETFRYYDILEIRNLNERNRDVEIIAAEKGK